MKPCGHMIPRLPDPPWSGDYCRVCYLYETSATYKRLWDDQGEATGAIQPLRTLPCLLLGPALKEGHCKCPRERVYRCAKHGAIVVGMCQTCPDYEAE
jgi:hypothetical protein